MVTTLTDEKRMAIAEKLADMKAIQHLSIDNEQRFLQESRDGDISDRFRKMLEDDRKNLGILETVIVQYGIQSDPRQTVREMVDKIQGLMKGSELSFYEKVAQHELLKHGQVMSGLLVHKAGQLVGSDVEAAIGPLNAVNFENRTHQEQLKGILEVLGTRELTGQDPDQSVWGRVQDAVAALGGVFGSAVTQTSDKSDMNIQDIIRLDHNKVKMLMREILNTDDSGKIQEYFGQLYLDLNVHAEAEQQVVYPTVRSFYDDTRELYDEHARMKIILDELKGTSPTASNFKDKIRQLMDIVDDHTAQEESSMFAAIRNNCSSDESEQLSTRFKEAKRQLQNQMAK